MKISAKARPAEGTPLNYPSPRGVTVVCVMSPNTALLWSVRENGVEVASFKGREGLKRARNLAEGLRETAQ